MNKAKKVNQLKIILLGILFGILFTWSFWSFFLISFWVFAPWIVLILGYWLLSKKYYFNFNNVGFGVLIGLVIFYILWFLSVIGGPFIGLEGRKSARDAKRISDLKQMSMAMELYYSKNKTYIGGCSGDIKNPASAGTITTDCLNNDYIDWQRFRDPEHKGRACTSGKPQICEYTLGITPAKDNYEFCAYLESKHKDFNLEGPGLIRITKDGFSLGCSY